MHKMEENINEMCSTILPELLSEIKLPGKYPNEFNYLLSPGLAVLHENYLVYSSHNYEDDVYNAGPCYDLRAIKVMDIRKKELTSEIDLEARVCDMTKMEDEQIAVVVRTGTDVFKINCISVSETGSLSRNCQFEMYGVHHFSCITYSSNNFFIGDGTNVKIMDIQGKELKTIATDLNGEDLFQMVSGVSVCPYDEKIYVSDIFGRSVTSVSLDGKVNNVYKVDITEDDDEGYGLTSIAVDNRGVVYVNDILRYKVYVLSEGSGNFETLIDNKEGPIALSRTENKMFVVNSDTVYIYQLN